MKEPTSRFALGGVQFGFEKMSKPQGFRPTRLVRRGDIELSGANRTRYACERSE